jgi:predicted HTH transcriptional regulator
MTIEDMKQGVSKIRNSVIARIFRELDLIEQWGSGVRRIFKEAEEQNLPEPQIVEIGMRIRFIVPLAEYLKIPATPETGGEPGAQLRAQSGAQSKATLYALREGQLSASELAEAMGLKSKTGAFKRTVKALLAHHLIEYTIPDKPSSRLQKYRLTPEGKAVISARRLEDKEKGGTT